MFPTSESINLFQKYNTLHFIFLGHVLPLVMIFPDNVAYYALFHTFSNIKHKPKPFNLWTFVNGLAFCFCLPLAIAKPSWRLRTWQRPTSERLAMAKGRQKQKAKPLTKVQRLKGFGLCLILLKVWNSA